MHIAINLRRGIPYASLMTSQRVNGRVEKHLVAYLGRVLDKDLGIFQSKERGVFKFDLTTQTYGPAPENFVPNVVRKNARENLLVDFGDAFLFDALIGRYGLKGVVDRIRYGNLDTVRALLLFYILEHSSNVYALCWWKGSFARFLYPEANLTSQRISDALGAIGQEDSLRAFFFGYLDWLGITVREGANILVDSTGLPNSIRFPLTAVSNHNGEISEEVRLIYVVQQGTRIPIYMRYVPGNIVDTTTLTTTIRELKAMGVNTKFAILDAGYVSEAGMRGLYDDNISFIMRCPTNRSVYKELLSTQLDSLESEGNLAVDDDGRLFNGRQVYVKCSPVTYKGMKLYAYLARDKAMQEVGRKNLINRCAGDVVDQKQLHAQMREQGVFVLLSTRRIKAKHVLSHYYVRQDVEQVFDIAKNYASLLPLRVENENTFRGHLLLTFIATVILQKLQLELKASPFSLDYVLKWMRIQKAKVFDNVVIPGEAAREQNDIYKILKVKPPKEVTRKMAS